MNKVTISVPISCDEELTVSNRYRPCPRIMTGGVPHQDSPPGDDRCVAVEEILDSCRARRQLGCFVR